MQDNLEMVEAFALRKKENNRKTKEKWPSSIPILASLTQINKYEHLEVEITETKKKNEKEKCLKSTEVLKKCETDEHKRGRFTMKPFSQNEKYKARMHTDVHRRY